MSTPGGTSVIFSTLEPARTATRVYPEMRKFVELLTAEGVPMAGALEAVRRLGVAPADRVVLEDAAPGAVAAHAAGMRCVAIPSLAAQADDPTFATAGLLVRGGQGEFTAREAYDWIVATR